MAAHAERSSRLLSLLSLGGSAGVGGLGLGIHMTGVEIG